MRGIDGEGVLVRVFIGESDRWKHQPLALAIVERLRREGFSGATVFRGSAGFGARSVLHTTQILRLSEDLPQVIEIVESPDKAEPLPALLDEMVSEGLVTVEKVRIVKYAAGDRQIQTGDAS